MNGQKRAKAMSTDKTRGAVLYARSACDDAGKGFIRQSEICQLWAKSNRCAVTGEYSEVASGAAASLPQLAEAVSQAEQHGAVLICTDLTRLAQRVDLYVRRVADTERHGVAVLFVQEG